MYRLTYIERSGSRRDPGLASEAAPSFKVEGFPHEGAALDRAREIIGASSVWGVELYSTAGEVLLDAEELAIRLGSPLPPSEPEPWLPRGMPAGA